MSVGGHRSRSSSEEDSGAVEVPPIMFVFPPSRLGPLGFSTTAGHADRAVLYELT